jgi:hypothetical protein
VVAVAKSELQWHPTAARSACLLRAVEGRCTRLNGQFGLVVVIVSRVQEGASLEHVREWLINSTVVCQQHATNWVQTVLRDLSTLTGVGCAEAHLAVGRRGEGYACLLCAQLSALFVGPRPDFAKSRIRMLRVCLSMVSV